MTRKQVKSVILTIVLIFICIFTANAKDPYNAVEILKKVESEYQSLNSYSDSGVVETPLEVISFKTTFMNPNLFKFIWSSKIKSNPKVVFNSVIWSSGEHVYSYYSYENKVIPKDSLDMAIASATGVSLGSAHNIPSLLGLSDGFKCTKINHPVLIGESAVGNELCYHIKGKHNRFDDTTYDLFVSKSTFMIRKIIRQIQKRRKVTIYNNIILNSDIPNSEFKHKQLIKNEIKG